MAPTNLIERRSDEQDVFALANAQRRLFNSRGEYYTDVTTTDATPTVIWFDAIPADSAAQLQTAVVGVENDASEAASYRFITTLRRVGTAAVTAVGATSVQATQEDTAAWNCTLAAGPATGEMSVLVTGEAGKTIFWRAHITLLVVPWR